MVLRIFATMFLSHLLVSCDSRLSDEGQTNQNKPFYQPWGVDLEARNEAVNPGDDFFEYANGNWTANNEIPSDRSRHGVWLDLRERVEKRLLDIIQDLENSNAQKGSSEQKIADYYRSWMNSERLNELGLTPLYEDIKRIRSISSLESLANEFGRQYLISGGSPFYAHVSLNPIKPDQYQLHLGLSGLGLPDRDYYLEEDEIFETVRYDYISHIRNLLEVAGVDSPEKNADLVFKLEANIAQIQWPRAQRRDRDRTNNPISLESLKLDFPGFNWDMFLSGIGVDFIDELNLNQPDTITPLIALVRDQPMETWRNYLVFHVIMNNAGILSDKIDKLNFDFRKTLTGQQEQLPRWKRGIDRVGARYGLGELLGKIYVERHFPSSSKKQMEDLVENLRKAFRNRIETITWMSEETKQEAYKKLSSFEPKIGYPEKWQDLNAIEIDESDLFGNARRILAYFEHKDIEKLDKPADKDEWFMTAHNVNAYYMASFNQIVFPAGILESPFFDPLADPAVNYGAIGAVIGHEMGHGFDDQGSKYDSRGVKRDWWRSDDRKNFENQTFQLQKQYDNFEVLSGQYIDGAFTLGENIGDLGGLEIAFEAYQISIRGERDRVLDGLTGKQRFFLAWAQAWRGESREEFLIRQLKSDPHSPSMYRVNGVVRNISAWYDAFDISEADQLYLPEDERVTIW